MSSKTLGKKLNKKTKNTKTSRQSFSKLGWVKHHKFKTFLILILVFTTGIFAYNKYLDWQNVNDMKQLLADFEQLERDIEAETGEEFYVEASCGSVGKFAESYACSLRLFHKQAIWNEPFSLAALQSETDHLRSFGDCAILDENSLVRDANRNHYRCNFLVRYSNRDASEEIFIKYDTSPGSPTRKSSLIK